jgi:putative tricarboxylic transport membrane protein
MAGLNRNSVCAIVILLAGGVFFWATFHIPDMNYESLGSEVWPRVILVLLFLLTSGYLFQSLKQGPDEAGEGGGLLGWIGRYRNALWCYGLFFAFLLTLDYFGMLIGGVLFVFLTLTALGNHTPRAYAIHAVVAIVSIAFMWSIFTFGLKVILPQGEIFSAW